MKNMNDIKNNVSFNVYEPELNMKFLGGKKSIITKILKNPDIASSRKEIKLNYKNINECSLHLKEFNIFRKKSEQIFQQKRAESIAKKDRRSNINRNAKNIKSCNTNKEKEFVLNRKLIEKLNKNVPNNLLDYIHPHEYRLNTINTNFVKAAYLTLQLNKSKENNDLKKSAKIIKLNDDILKNKTVNFFYKLNNKLKILSNKHSLTFKSLINSNNIIKLNHFKSNTHSNFKKKGKIFTIKKKKEILDKNNDGDSSSSLFTEIINNKVNLETDTNKKLYINGHEVQNLNTFPSKSVSQKKNKHKIQYRNNNNFRYNQKIFNRNNKIFSSYEDLKKKVFHLDNLTISQKKKNSKNFYTTIFNNSDVSNNTNENNKKDDNKFLNEIKDLNYALNEMKFYALSDKIDREKFNKKFNELLNKINFKEDKSVMIKDIMFEKMSNTDNQEDFISQIINKPQFVNELISSYDNTNEKKFGKIMDKKFLGGLRKLKDLDLKDSAILNDIRENNYKIKQNINKFEENKIKKNRKKLEEKTKEVKKLVERIYNKRIVINRMYEDI